MQNFKIDALKKAVFQFEKGVIQSSQNPHEELMRDGVIQRFEYTMELSWKLMGRYLKTIIMIDESLIIARKDLFREAAKIKLIDDAEMWFEYYKARNQTSHDYEQEKANEVYQKAVLFLTDVKKLVKRFEEILDAS